MSQFLLQVCQQEQDSICYKSAKTPVICSNQTRMKTLYTSSTIQASQKTHDPVRAENLRQDSTPGGQESNGFWV